MEQIKIICYLIYYLFIYLFIYLWLCWVFVSARGPSPVAASGGHSSSRCEGLSLSQPLLLRSTGSRRAGSVFVAHGPSCSAACGILPDQGSNPCPLHWQADSQPLRHQGSPNYLIYCYKNTTALLWLSCKKSAKSGSNHEEIPIEPKLRDILITSLYSSKIPSSHQWKDWRTILY